MAAAHPLLILYGSQTGNAQDVAERVAREAARRHYAPRVLPADAYLQLVAGLPAEPALVWIASTTGQGDPPDNMRQLWRFLLRKSLAPGSLGGLRAAVFGLGDSGYPKYNVTAKKLFRRLEALGAHMLLPVGLGDDQHASGYEAALDPWLAQLWPALRAAFPLPAGLSEPAPTDTTTELVCKYQVTWLSSQEAVAAAGRTAVQADVEAGRTAVQADVEAGSTSCAWSAHEEAVSAAAEFDRVEASASGMPPALQQQASRGQPSTRAAAGPATSAGHGAPRGAGQDYGPGRPYWACLTANKRITAPTHFQDVRLLDIDLGRSGIQFEPGDVLGIVPQQPAGAIEALCHRCGWDPQAWVRIEPVLAAADQAAEAGAPQAQEGDCSAAGAGTCSCTVRLGALIAGALDVNGASPRRFFFQVLHKFAQGSELEKERLAYFSSPQGRDDLYQYNQREGRTVLEVLSDFRTVQLPLDWLLQACPRLKPRYFSIASSLATYPHSAQLAVAIVDWATPFKRRRRGVCTSWLAALDPQVQGNVRLPVWVERGALRLPPSPSTPLLMVGPGTGVAPFRSFLQDRQAALLAGDSHRHAPCTLFFGCRNEAGDFYFREEWEAMQAQGVLAPPPRGLVTAFSRDGPSKVYVQDRIRDHAADIWAALQAGANVYVAGSADKMPAAVAAAIQQAVAQQGGMTLDEAAAYVRRLELSGRYQVEAWS